MAPKPVTLIQVASVPTFREWSSAWVIGGP
jgi:hypothetical protein